MSESHRVEDVLYPWLEELDKRFSEDAIEPSDRPLRACIFLASNGIVRGPEGPTEEFEFLDEDWFAAVYSATEKWFIKRYGKRALRRGDETVPGLILIYGTPFRLDIPLTTSKVEKPGETSWLCFPDSLSPEEDVFSWIHEAPDLESMEEPTIETLKNDISDVVGHVRSTRLNTMTAEFDEENGRRFANSVEVHLANAVGAICSMQPDRLSISQWEIHLSIEKALKSVVIQKTGRCPKSHDLVEIHKLATDSGMTPVDDRLLRNFPHAAESVGHRYCELPPPSVSEADRFYRTGLETIDHATSELRRQMVLKNAQFLIRRAPWIRQRGLPPGPGIG